MRPCPVAAEVGGRDEATGSFEIIELSIRGRVRSADVPQERTSPVASQEWGSVGVSQECCSADDSQDGAGSERQDGAGAASEEFQPTDAAAGAIISAARYAGSPSHGG